MSDVKLYYFNGTGRAMQIRLALVAGGVDFEDVVPPGLPTDETKEQWGALTKGTTTFAVPILTVGEKVYVQSSAILRAAGRMGDLAMTLEDKDQAAYLEDRAIADADDLRTVGYRNMTFFGATSEAADKYITEIFPKHMKCFEAQVQGFPEGTYWGGSSTLSLADVTLYEAVEFFGLRLFEGIEGQEDPLKDCPGLKKWMEKVGSNQRIKDYLASDKYNNLYMKFGKAMLGKE